MNQTIAAILPYSGHRLVVARIMRRVIMFLLIPVIGIAIGVYLMDDARKALILLSLLPFLALMLWALYKGFLRPTVIIITLTILGVNTWSCVTGNGIHDIGITVFPIAILFGCLLLRPFDLWIISLITAACIVFVILGEKYGLYQSAPVHPGRLADVVIMSLIMIAGLVIISNVASNLKSATGRAELEIENLNRLEIELSESITEKSDLFREVHHRVKNHLAFINSLIDLQTMTHPDLDQQYVRELQGRINAVARVHDQLYHTDDYTVVGTKKYLESIVSQFMMTYRLTETYPDLKIDDFKMEVNKIIYLGISIHEIIRTIAIQELGPHKIEFILTKATRTTHLTVIFDHPPGKRLNAESSSMDILRLLTSKLNGNLEIIGGERKALLELEF